MFLFHLTKLLQYLTTAYTHCSDGIEGGRKGLSSLSRCLLEARALFEATQHAQSTDNFPLECSVTIQNSCREGG